MTIEIIHSGGGVWHIDDKEELLTPENAFLPSCQTPEALIMTSIEQASVLFVEMINDDEF